MSEVVAPARARLIDDLRGRVFGLDAPRAGPERFGLEVELIPVLARGGTPAPLRSEAGPSILGALEPLARDECWRRGRAPTGSPRFVMPEGGEVSFEPGGQLEYSSPPLGSVDEAVGRARARVEAIDECLRARGIELVARGIDPENPSERASLQVGGDRYERLARHLSRNGESGRRMMLQTAAIHVNLDLGPVPTARWRTANALVPHVIALFANSSRYAGRETGFRSFRARQWQLLDPARSGVVTGDDPVRAYLEFALAADAILLGEPDEPARPYGEWLDRGMESPEAWRDHLSTLFPEVRPRGYVEVRCVDALPPPWYAAPVVFLAGLLLDEEARSAVEARFEPPGPAELSGAARDGMGDPDRARRALHLFDVALEGAERLGPETVGDEALETARAFRDRYAAGATDPAADPEAGGP